ncbi:hypothetical protein [uncultured Porphyromonas sp.]|uniref:hypothetical protein n=1 Tax=uncultured Porphyromonas sp. TaxID=159274 RepID=UPI0025E4D5DF|nr:hypothetical protein [uncultured Porphyromonas sp.]
MKNVATVLAAAAVALAFTACSKTNNGVEPTDEGTTGLQLSVSYFKAQSGNRAITDGQDKEVEGTDAENAIKSGQLLISDRAAIDIPFGTPVNNVWTSKVIKTNPAPSVTITPLINMAALGFTKADLDKDKTVAIADIDKLASATGGFAMSTSAADASNTQEIVDGVTDPKGENKNFFKFTLQRVVSKAQLWAATVNVEGAKKYGVIDPSTLQWSMAGSAKQAYLYTDYAGNTKADISLSDDGFYPALTTISAKAGKTAEGVTAGTKVYDLMKQSDYAANVGEYKADTEAGVKNFKARNVLTDGVDLNAEQTNGKSLENGIYFLEHALKETVKGSTTPYEPSKVTYGDVAYVKVYGKINIKKGKKVDAKVQTEKPDMSKASELYVAGLKAADVKEATEADFGDRYYFIVVRKDSKWYNINRKVKAAVLADRDAETAYYLVHDKAGEFYAAGDGEDAVVYNTLAAALADGQTKIRKYWGADKDFNVVYLSPLNAQGEVNKVYNCDTRRNNIYDLKLRTISGLGFNYDPNDPDTPKDPSKLVPSDPNDPKTITPIDPNDPNDPNNPNNPDKGKTPGDPNIPTPGEDNPFEPEPTNPPVNNTKTCLQVECTVLSWNLVQRALDFTGGTSGL